jgi:RNA polymerase sigma-70 factor (ECF subfamily)
MSGNGMAAASGASERSTEQQAIRGEMNACIRGVIDRLPDNYKVCIVLSDLEGLKDSEVAAALGLGLQAAKMRLHRARERLKEELSRYCVFHRNEENEFICDVKKQEDADDS